MDKLKHHKHLDRAEVLNLVYTGQADAMADAYARLMADYSQMTAWGRGLEADMHRLRVLDSLKTVSFTDSPRRNDIVSEPKRHFLKISKTISGLRCDTFEDKDGMYVDYEDYARLKAEVERLTNGIKAIDPLLLEAINSATIAKEGNQP